jgi:predicted RNA-binding protein with RPS1 domain
MLRANGVFVSNEELKLLFEKFGDNSGKNVNYVNLSEVLGLTTMNLNLNQVVKLHQHVTVKVVEVDEDRKRIQLTMIL